MITISPSLLSCDFLNIEKEIDSFKSFNNIWLHLDIMDGHFVPNLTFGQDIIKKISKITSIPLDAHFMVTNPKFYIESLKDCSIYNFTFHYEAAKDHLAIIKEAKKHFKSVGISLKPNTPVSALSKEILSAVDLVLVMSVEPGFGGQSFIESSYEKLREIKKLKTKYNLNFELQVDGGVSNSNAKELVENGATNLVAGSHIFKKGSKFYQEQIESLRT